MADEQNPAVSEPVDPLSSPTWLFAEEDDVLLAPRPEDFFSELAAMKTQTSSTGEIEIPASAIVADPDAVTSPAEALDQARKRIAAMRASLQLNLNQVAQSFSHPIFTPPTEPTSASSQTSESDTSNLGSTRTSSAPIVEPEITIPAATTSAPLEDEFVQPTRVFTPTESEPQPEAQVQSTGSDHSLELMIMRDEIKDLRDRLDASQKLIEELMHRLANLAELALRR
ncbi:MAG: hypothetical protein EBR84_02415 [Actinobacteria bacterium]|nr:hypothetical protein [Actinomycetota bacterium]